MSDPLNELERLDGSMLLQAALDGELDTPAMLQFERRLAEDPHLAAEYRRLQALREAMRKVPKLHASDAFRTRIAALGGQAEKASPLQQSRGWLADWRPAVLSASIALILGSGLTLALLPTPTPDVTQELLAGHIRGMISGQLADVATSDRHTVKPWFATRVTVAPQVVDLSGEGFTLIGGRIDMLDDKPVATLVFQRSKHIISVAELPRPLAPTGMAEGHRTVKGYSVLTWTMGEAPENATTYIAISDIAPSGLDALAAAFRKEAGEK